MILTVERPDRTGREQILRVHIARRALPLADDVSVAGIASSTTGFTGADLANLVNEAALLAGRGSKGARCARSPAWLQHPQPSPEQADSPCQPPMGAAASARCSHQAAHCGQHGFWHDERHGSAKPVVTHG